MTGPTTEARITIVPTEHRWVAAVTDDGHQYRACITCGKSVEDEARGPVALTAARPWAEMYADHERLAAAIHRVISEAEATDRHPHEATFDCRWFADQLLAALRPVEATKP